MVEAMRRQPVREPAERVAAALEGLVALEHLAQQIRVVAVVALALLEPLLSREMAALAS